MDDKYIYILLMEKILHQFGCPKTFFYPGAGFFHQQYIYIYITSFMYDLKIYIYVCMYVYIFINTRHT